MHLEYADPSHVRLATQAHPNSLPPGVRPDESEDDPNERNFPSDERERLLATLDIKNDEQSVSSSLWATLYYAEITVLRTLAALNDEQVQTRLKEYEERWFGKRNVLTDFHGKRHGKAESDEEAEDEDDDEGDKEVVDDRHPLSATIWNAVEDRDVVCVIILAEGPLEVCHIIPKWLLSSQQKMKASEERIFDYLEHFWPSEGYSWRNLKDKLADPSNKDKPVQLENLITMAIHARSQWHDGWFALKPRPRTAEHTQDLEFYWQRQMFSRVRHGEREPQRAERINRIPLDVANRLWLLPRTLCRPLRDGTLLQQPVLQSEVIHVVTFDPATRPLPDYDLLRLSWHIRRVIRMAGIARLIES